MLASVLLSSALVIAQAPSTVPNPTVDARARDWFSRLQQDRIDYSQLDSDAALPLDTDVSRIVAFQWSQLGAPTSFDEVAVRQPLPVSGQQQPETGNRVYVYRVGFAQGVVLDFLFEIDAGGKIAGMRLAPEQH